MALANAITGPFLTLAPLLGAAVATAFGYRALFLACMAIYLADVGVASWAARGAATLTAVPPRTPPQAPEAALLCRNATAG